MGKVFHIQRCSLHDGPGVRTVVFLKGCPLRCIWCHNPEGLSFRQEILFHPDRCIGCMDCAAVCPAHCHSRVQALHAFDRTDCTACGACAAACCSGALSLAGKEMTPEAVLEQVLRDRAYYGQTGGLTLSGGEPFAQPEFALRLLQLAKDAGLHTAVETCGYAPAEVIRQAAACTDLFLYDCKATDPAMHKALCGVSNETILSNLALLDTLEAAVILRCPIVPGQNDTHDHISGIAATALAHSCITQVHLEPYHSLGKSKAAQLGTDTIFDTAPPTQESMTRYRSTVEALCGKPTLIHT